MKIKYTENDPRHGRVVNLAESLAQRFIDAGVAVEAGPDEVSTTGKDSDIAHDDGSRGLGKREGVGPNSPPEETTITDEDKDAMDTIEGEGEIDPETGEPRKATGPKANKSMTAAARRRAAAKKAGRK